LPIRVNRKIKAGYLSKDNPDEDQDFEKKNKLDTAFCINCIKKLYDRPADMLSIGK
jgi:hypothetical protein